MALLTEQLAAQLREGLESLTDREKRQAVRSAVVKETLILIIKCAAPEGLFEGDFDDLSSEQQELYIGSNRVICDAGTLGRWCLDCRFGKCEEEWEFG